MHWSWAGVAYHWAYFRSINPAAALFGGLFVLEGALLAWFGVLRPRLRFTSSQFRWGWLAWALICYAMLYPLIGLASGLAYPQLPTFGVPCPTTILTAAALLLAPPRSVRAVAVIPILWAGVGGSAAFVLGIRADLCLLLAGGTLILYILTPLLTSSAPG